MTRKSHERMVEESVFNDLYYRLRVWWATKHIEDQAYVTGLHVLAKMARHDSLELAITWSELVAEHVVAGKELIAGPVSAQRLMFLGALQQLHHIVGLLSHVHQAGMESAVEEAHANLGVTHHFTKTPGEESDLIGPDTLLLFRFVPGFGYDETKAYEDFCMTSKAVKLPTWVKMASVGAHK